MYSFFRILGFLFSLNCNRHRHRFRYVRGQSLDIISYRLKGGQLPTEGQSVTD